MTKQRRKPAAIDPSLGRLSHTAERARTTSMWQRLRRFVPNSAVVRLRRSGQFIYSSRLQPDDGLLLSYPKSGSTWVRNMLAIAIAGHEVPPNELARWIPPLHLVSSRDPSATVLRSHDPVNTPGFDRAARIVVLVRDPRALAVSWMHHQQQRGAIGYSADDAAAELVGNGFLNLGSWQSHMRSLLDRSDQRRVLTMRYKDLVLNPAGGLESLCEHLRIDVTTEIVELAVSLTTPGALRDRLVESGVESSEQAVSLVREASSDSWRTECPENATEHIVAAASAEMTELGFTP